MSAGAERVLYGIDDIITDGLIWVEGEMDRLSIETAGYRSCVSVPDGAPAVTSKNYAAKFSYLDTAQDILEKVEKHFLAVDADAPGQRLQEELTRRLGAEKCYVVRWPDGCKDANDTLVKHGAGAIVDAINAARPAPIEGIITAGDCVDSLAARYEEGPRRGVSTGWACMDYFYTVRAGEWTAVTGIPGHGKSEWLDALAVNVALAEGWRFGVCSPENQPIEEHIQKLAEKYIGKPFYQTPGSVRMSRLEMEAAREWIDDHFTFILPEEPRLDCVLGLAKAMVRRNGINGLIIDPWNEIEYSREAGMSETEHISKCLTKIRRFARTHAIHIWVVAHPTKMQKDKDTGKYLPPTLYDISGSAHWRNKADNGITVYREIGENTNKVKVVIGKIRFKIVGRPGQTELRYDYITGRYEG